MSNDQISPTMPRHPPRPLKPYEAIQRFCHPNRRTHDEIIRQFGSSKTTAQALGHCVRHGYVRVLSSGAYLAIGIEPAGPSPTAMEALGAAFGIRRPKSLERVQWVLPWQTEELAQAIPD